MAYWWHANPSPSLSVGDSTRVGIVDQVAHLTRPVANRAITSARDMCFQKVSAAMTWYTFAQEPGSRTGSVIRAATLLGLVALGVLLGAIAGARMTTTTHLHPSPRPPTSNSNNRLRAMRWNRPRARPNLRLHCNRRRHWRPLGRRSMQHRIPTRRNNRHWQRCCFVQVSCPVAGKLLRQVAVTETQNLGCAAAPFADAGQQGRGSRDGVSIGGQSHVRRPELTEYPESVAELALQHIVKVLPATSSPTLLD